MKTIQTLKNLEGPFNREQAEAIVTAIEDQGIVEMRRDLILLKWMQGFNLAMTIAVLWKVFGG